MQKKSDIVGAWPFSSAQYRDSYRRLVLARDRVIGAVILGHHPQDVASAQKAVQNGITLGAAAQRDLHSGDWSVLGDVVATT